MRIIHHPGLKKFVKNRKIFAADTCRDGSFNVVSIDAKGEVKLISLKPHLRTEAGIMDPFEEDVKIQNMKEFR
ncbi:MAG: hypothetical protein OEZ34_03555 [Spirochaetia bacterium]|nr:hypothetical protein [Spirochaetia bacterium]